MHHQEGRLDNHKVDDLVSDPRSFPQIHQRTPGISKEWRLMARPQCGMNLRVACTYVKTRTKLRQTIISYQAVVSCQANVSCQVVVSC